MAATIKCDTIQNAGSANPNITLDTNGNATVGNTLAMGSSFLRNRIINGDMRIDQRNAGASVTPSTSGSYLVDRWTYSASQASKFTAQQTPSSTETGYAARITAGFTNYLAFTVSSSVSITASDYFVTWQKIEGLNTSDLAWGTAGAKTVTLSFLVYSSLTGTFGGAITNSAQNRSYPFSYSIASANTWTSISVTIPGDTSGTWLTTNGVGISVIFGMGVGSTYSGTPNAWAGANYYSATSATSVVGTNGAAFYITGVQLEAGSVATPYERRQYGHELALCQRYYHSKIFNIQPVTAFGSQFFFPVPMRVAPTLSGGGAGFTSTVNTEYLYCYQTTLTTITLVCSAEL